MAWDVYCLYDASAQWEQVPTQPDFWMRRFSRGTEARFKLAVKEMLSQIQ